MRIVFMGTPEFASVSLAELISRGYEIAGVFTQPDKAKGRGMELTYSPVKQLAIEHGIPVFQPAKMRDGTALEILESLKPDLVVVVAYGRILPDDLLAVPPLGTINVHGSLLPKYRGCAPIQWAVLNGDKITGVSTMYLSERMDAGDVIFSEETAIGEFETSGELFDRLMVMGAALLVKTLAAIEAGNAPRTPQNEAEACGTQMLDKSLCPIDWRRSPREIVKWICGLQPWPVATAEIDGVLCRVFAAEYTKNHTSAAPATIVATGREGIEFACGGGQTLLITEIQVPGKKRMRAADYLLGHPIQVSKHG